MNLKNTLIDDLKSHIYFDFLTYFHYNRLLVSEGFFNEKIIRYIFNVF